MITNLSKNIKIYNNLVLSFIKPEFDFLEKNIVLISLFYISNIVLLTIIGYCYKFHVFTTLLSVNLVTFTVCIILSLWKKVNIFSQKIKKILVLCALAWIFVFANNYTLYISNLNSLYGLSYATTILILTIFLNISIIIGLLVTGFIILKYFLLTSSQLITDYSLLVAYILFLAIIVTYVKIIIKNVQHNFCYEQSKNLEKKFFLKTSYILHDIINPLHGILGITSSLIENKSRLDKEKYVEQLENVNQALISLSSSVDNMLLNNKIQLQQGVISMQQIEIIALTKNIILDLQKIYPQAVIILDNNIEELFITADKMQICQLLNNIIINAVKYGKNSDILIKINMCLENNKQYVKIQTIDGGDGICSNKLKNIFELYNRADTKENIYGIGLGLALCKEIVSNHNGFIWGENNNSTKGAIFTVLLPS